MARARNIKFSFWSNELLGEADPFVNLTFIGLWGLADRTGRLEDRPLRIKAEIFPYREGLDVNGYLTELERLGFLERYEVDGAKYIHILKFEQHQSPHHTEKAKGYPAKPLNQKDIGCVTVKQPDMHEKVTVSARSDLLNPDSSNPEYGFIDSSNHKSQQAAPSPQAAGKGKSKSDYPDWFEEIWKLYPTRIGSNDKGKAFKAANARLKSDGRTIEELRNAVERYRYFVVATGKASTEYVKQAATFFGPNDNLDNPWHVPTSPNPSGRPPKFDALAYVNRGVPATGSPAEQYDQNVIDIHASDVSTIAGGANA